MYFERFLSGDFLITNDYVAWFVNILTPYHELGFEIYLKNINIFQMPDLSIIVDHTILFFLGKCSLCMIVELQCEK